MRWRHFTRVVLVRRNIASQNALQLACQQARRARPVPGGGHISRYLGAVFAASQQRIPYVRPAGPCHSAAQLALGRQAKRHRLMQICNVSSGCAPKSPAMQQKKG